MKKSYVIILGAVIVLISIVSFELNKRTAVMPQSAGFAHGTLNTMHDPLLGDYVAAENGMTLYLYTKDDPGKSNCFDQCAANWPPYTVKSAQGLNADKGIGGAVGTITRPDGTLQVTYKNTPLYFWVKDKKPGDTTGQNVGGVWYIMHP